MDASPAYRVVRLNENALQNILVATIGGDLRVIIRDVESMPYSSASKLNIK